MHLRGCNLTLFDGFSEAEKDEFKARVFQSIGILGAIKVFGGALPVLKHRIVRHGETLRLEAVSRDSCRIGLLFLGLLAQSNTMPNWTVRNKVFCVDRIYNTCCDSGNFARDGELGESRVNIVDITYS